MYDPISKNKSIPFTYDENCVSLKTLNDILFNVYGLSVIFCSISPPRFGPIE